MMNFFIGYLMVVLAITSLFTFMFGYDLELKDKVLLIVGIMVFMTLLTVGASLCCS